MASASGNSSGSTQIQNSSSEGDLQCILDQRKRKRMLSNRESARRSRLRKQKHLDDLTAQVDQLRKENGRISTSVNLISQNYVKVEAENSVLRAQMAELTQRLDSLDEILNTINSTAVGGGAAAGGCTFEAEEFPHLGFGDGLYTNSPWGLLSTNQNYPIMASAQTMFNY